jgi:hypothetical protein
MPGLIALIACGLGGLLAGLIVGYLLGWSVGHGDGFEEAERLHTD